MQLPQVPFQIKYGIISNALFKADMLEWKYIYVSGRLHKPVRLLQEPTNETAFGSITLQELIVKNRLYALSSSLLTLPPSFTVADILVKIAGLSYSGDFRMQVGEHPDKVQNLVQGDVAGFFDLYQPFLRHFLEEGYLVSTDESRDALEELLSVPSSPSMQLRDLQTVSCETSTFDATKHHLEVPPSFSITDPSLLEGQIRSRIANTALSQSLKGIVSAGFRKSAVYAGLKVLKKFKK